MEDLIGNIVIILIVILAIGFIAYGYYQGAVTPLGKPSDLEMAKKKDEQEDIVH